MLTRARQRARPRWVADALEAQSLRNYLGSRTPSGGLLIWGLVGSDHHDPSNDHVLDGACAAFANHHNHLASSVTGMDCCLCRPAGYHGRDENGDRGIRSAHRGGTIPRCNHCHPPARGLL